MSENIDKYQKCLEKSLEDTKIYGCKIPVEDLNNYNHVLLEHLSLDDKDLKVLSIFKAAIAENESIRPSSNLTFSENRYDEYKQGRFSRFRRHDSFLNITNDRPSRKLEGFDDAVGDYRRKFCYIDKVITNENAITNDLVRHAVDHNITYNRALEKGIQFENIKLMGYLENGDFCSYVYIKSMDCKLWVHNPDSVILDGRYDFEIVNEWSPFLSIADTFSLDTFPILRLSHYCTWTARSKAEIEYGVCQGVGARAWTKVFSLGINAIWEEEKSFSFHSPTFQVEITGSKLLFDTPKPPKIELSEQAAKNFLNSVNGMRAMQFHLQKPDELAMIADQARNNFDEDKADEILLGLIDLSLGLIDNNLNRLKLYNACKGYSAIILISLK